MPKKKSTPPAVPEVSQLRQLWEALNTRLVDLPDVPGLTMTRANTAGRAPAWRAPSNRSVMAESPSLSGSIARALQGSSRPTPVRPSPSQAVLGLGGQAVEALSSPLDLASMYFGGAGTLAKGVGLPALARLLGRTALAADVAQTVPAVVRGAQTFGEGVRTGRPELVVGGGAQGALGALGLKRTLGRGGRIVEAEEAFKRTPVSEPGEGFESIEIPAASKEEPGFWMRVPTRQISPEHPFRTGRVPYAILTSENPRGGLPEVMPLEDLTMGLRRKGYSPVPVRGDYGGEERSLLIPGMPEDEAMALGRELQQNAIITQRGMQRSDNPVIDVPIDVESKPGATEYFSEFRDPATGRLEKMAFDFGATPDFDPARGARALAPMRRELEGAGPMVLLQHRSTSPRLAGGELRPSAVGMRTKAEQAMGTPGAERGRFMRYPDVFQPRSYATVGGGQVEPLLQDKTSLFEGVTPMRRIYDLAEDPLNLRAVAEEKAQQYAARLGKFPSLDLTETFLEKEVADQGFLGATYGPWRSQLSRGWEFGSPLPEKATTPRGDQLMLFQPFRMNRTR